MKKYFKTAAVLALMSVAIVACKKKDDPAPTTTTPPTPGAKTRLLSSNITSNTTLYSDTTYSLGNFVYVKSGATLTIQPGTKISNTVIQSGLIVEMGAKIMAVGTASKPIIFTSGNGNPRRGDWAGIVICGLARTNNYVATQPIIEGGLSSKYGSVGNGPATGDADNSGTLSYVRIEYAGYAPTPGSELNGLSLYAVGSGTTINNVQVTAANDDSFEWFGGTVNCDHLIAYMGIDDDFDTDNGYSGKVQYGLGVRSQYIADQSGSKGFESDNNGSANGDLPLTTAQFSNMTVVGPVNSMGTLSTSAAPVKISNNYIAAMHLRRNSAMSVMNSVMIGWPTAILIDSKTGTSNVTNANIISGVSMVKNNLIAGVSKNYKANATSGAAGTDLRAFDAVAVVNGQGDGTIVSLSPVNTISDTSSLSWPSYATGPKSFAYASLNANRYQYSETGILINAFSETNPGAYNFTLSANSPAATGSSFTGLTGFQTTTYVGAFGATDWTAGWASFPNTNNQ